MSGETFICVRARPDVPIIQLMAAGDVKHLSYDEFLRVYAFVSSKRGPLSVTWSLFHVRKSALAERLDLARISPSRVSRNFSQIEIMSATELMLSLIIPPRNHPNDHANFFRACKWGELESDGSYVLRLSVINSAGEAHTDIPFRVHSPPNVSGVTVEPNHGVMALVTIVRLKLTHKLNSSEFRGLFRFGMRTHLTGGYTRDFWTRSSVVDFYEMLLPSAWPEPHAACGERVALQALAEVCNIWGACTRVEGERFVVSHPIDAKIATETIIASIQARLVDGDGFKAMELLEALREERCNDSIDVQLVDQVLSKLSNTQDVVELLEGLQLAMHLSSYASSRRVDEVFKLVNRVRDSLHMNSTNWKPDVDSEIDTLITARSRPRLKRNVNLKSVIHHDSSFSTGINEAAASTLLSAYDLLVSRKQDVVRVYLNNIKDIIAGFCVQSNTLNAIRASSETYTRIQSQNLMPGELGFVNTAYNIAGVDKKILSLNQNFSALFSIWQCTNGSMCSEICVGTAQTQLAALNDNAFLQRRFFNSQSTVNLEKAVSNLYHFHFLDPIDGSPQNLRSGAAMHVDVPILKYVPSDYYKCFLYMGSAWDDHVCESDAYARSLESFPMQFYLTCRCSKVGILAVFTVNPPTPPQYSPYQEIQLTFYLSTSQACTISELHAFIEQFADTSNIDKARFVQMSCNLVNGTGIDVSGRIVESTLAIIEAIQAIKRTIDMDSGFVAYGQTKVLNVTKMAVPRRLNRDRNARRITFHIDYSYWDVIGNDPVYYASRWITQMAEDMRLSVYRFKNPKVTTGMLFNITITVPFVGEALLNMTILSAEEIAQWIKEQVHYDELELRDSRGQLLPVKMLTEQDIVQLRVAQNTTTLTIALSIIISTLFMLMTICAGSIIFIKIRNDRLIKSHNSNICNVDITKTVSLNVQPAASDNNSDASSKVSRKPNPAGKILRLNKKAHNHVIPRQNITIRSARAENKAADTVIFRGRHTLNLPSD